MKEFIPDKDKYYSKEIALDVDEIQTFSKPLNQNSAQPELIRDTIKILTYNFFSRPPPVNTNGTDYKDERLNDFIEFLPEFDIICFQEIFTTLTDRKHQMIREAAKCGFKYHVSSKPPSFLSEYITDAGLLILSRYEIM